MDEMTGYSYCPVVLSALETWGKSQTRKTACSKKKLGEEKLWIEKFEMKMLVGNVSDLRPPTRPAGRLEGFGALDKNIEEQLLCLTSNTNMSRDKIKST